MYTLFKDVVVSQNSFLLAILIDILTQNFGCRTGISPMVLSYMWFRLLVVNVGHICAFSCAANRFTYALKCMKCSFMVFCVVYALRFFLCLTNRNFKCSPIFSSPYFHIKFTIIPGICFFKLLTNLHCNRILSGDNTQKMCSSLVYVCILAKWKKKTKSKTGNKKYRTNICPAFSPGKLHIIPDRKRNRLFSIRIELA